MSETPRKCKCECGRSIDHLRKNREFYCDETGDHYQIFHNEKKRRLYRAGIEKLNPDIIKMKERRKKDYEEICDQFLSDNKTFLLDLLVQAVWILKTFNPDKIPFGTVISLARMETKMPVNKNIHKPLAKKFIADYPEFKNLIEVR
jgi:hypothetical protein